MEAKKFAIVRIRGKNKIFGKIEDTMKMLKLYDKNSCIIVNCSDSMIGMIHKIKDYVTWGEVSEETIKILLEKRGKIFGKKPLTEDYLKSKTKLNYEQLAKEVFEGKKSLKDIPGLKTYFRLKPPTGGFERKGIKVPYSMGGTVGYRREKINDLIKKMI